MMDASVRDFLQNIYHGEGEFESSSAVANRNAGT